MNLIKGTITVWIIQAYEKEESGELFDLVVLEIIADSFDIALSKAKKLVEKPNYRLSRVIEKEIV